MLPHVIRRKPQKKEKRASLSLIATDAKLLVGNHVAFEASVRRNDAYLSYGPCSSENQITSHSLAVLELSRLVLCEENKAVVKEPTLAECEVISTDNGNTFVNEEPAADV
jgi:hypothetical protein